MKKEAALWRMPISVMFWFKVEQAFQPALWLNRLGRLESPPHAQRERSAEKDLRLASVLVLLKFG